MLSAILQCFISHKSTSHLQKFQMTGWRYFCSCSMGPHESLVPFKEKKKKERPFLRINPFDSPL